MGAVDISIDVGARLPTVPLLAFPGVEEVIEDVAFELGEYIDETVPRDTGLFQSEWESVAEGLIWTIRNAVDYAEFVHQAGTTVLYWTEVQAQAERLLSAALPEMIAVINRHAVSFPLGVFSPRIQSRGVVGVVGDLFFRSRSRARERDTGRTRAR